MDTTFRLFAMYPRRRVPRGFTLVEMLVVISIVSILSILVTTGLQSVLGSAEDRQVSDMASTLGRARAYAMANNTYVFVGIQEVSVSNPSNGTQTAGTGRIAMAVMASSDGTRGYPNPITSSANYPLPTSLIEVSPLRHFDNLHLLSSAGTGISNLPNTSTTSSTTSYVGSGNPNSAPSLISFTCSSGPQYPTFGGSGTSNNTVIQFNPLGQAQIVTGPFTDSVLQWIEIDLAPTHGTTVSGKNPATILIDGASGSVSTYRE